MEDEKQISIPSEGHGGGSGPGSEGREHPCKGCFHWRGWTDWDICCNYIFDTGRCRPCDPGEGCTVKRPRGRLKLEQIREIKRLK